MIDLETRELTPEEEADRDWLLDQAPWLKYVDNYLEVDSWWREYARRNRLQGEAEIECVERGMCD